MALAQLYQTDAERCVCVSREEGGSNPQFLVRLPLIEIQQERI